MAVRREADGWELMRTRLERLERRERGWRWAAALCLAGGLALFGMQPGRSHQAVQKVAAPFQVVDAEGLPILTVTRNSRSDGSPVSVLQLLDPNGRVALQMNAYQGRSELELRDEHGRLAALLNTCPGASGLALYHAPDNMEAPVGAVLAASPDEGGALTLFDEKGSLLYGMPHGAKERRQ